jgi:signal transduction histidine kinase
MIGFSQLLEARFDTYSTEQIKTRISKLHKAAERLYALLENLLTWSRIHRGAMVYHPNKIDLSELAEEMSELFATRAEQKQLILEVSLGKGLIVYADYNMLHTVLRNLISNAMKFTNQGGLVELAAVTCNEHEVEISVADSGIGIKPEDVEKLFRIDAQYTNLGTDGEKGTGLGLSLCKDLVEKNGGTIWVESEAGKGTTFRFTVPTAKSHLT